MNISSVLLPLCKSLNISLLLLLQTSSTSRSCRPCSCRWRRRLACVCSTAGKSFVSTCRPKSCGRTIPWACVAPSMATSKMTSCKCALADLWPLLHPLMTLPLVTESKRCSCFRGREGGDGVVLSLSLCNAHWPGGSASKASHSDRLFKAGYERPTGHGTSTRNLLLEEKRLHCTGR